MVEVEVVSTLDAAKQIQIFEYLVLSAFTFLIYDHALTLGDEIRYFWRRPITQSAIWFFVNRYVAFFGNIASIVLEWLDFPPESRLIGCFIFNLLREVILVINLLIVCALLIMRTYALYNRSRIILIFLLVTGISLVSIALWLTFGGSSQAMTDPNLRGCYTGLPFLLAARYAAAFEANFLFDTIIFTLTTLRTWRGRKALRLGGRSVSLVAIMLRDGALYYGAMALVNLANVMTHYFPPPYLRGCLSTFTSGMCVTLMSRLMLNLHVNEDTVYVHNDYHLPSTLQQTAQSQNIELKPVWPRQLDTQVANINTTGTLIFHPFEKAPHYHTKSSGV